MLGTETTPLHGAGILQREETPVRRDAWWLGSAVPKGLGASQTRCAGAPDRQEELSSSWPGGGRADGFVITSNALQRVGEFHFHASEV